MDNKMFFALVIVCTITHIVRSIYEILKHKKILKPDKLTFVIVFINMLLLWMSWFTLCTLDICKIHPGLFVRLLGIVISSSGIVVFLIALFTIKTLESYEGDLITRGIYSWFRHPMYLGFILWLIGFPIIFGAVFSSLLALMFIVNILFWRSLEEKELDKRFSSYSEYKKTTLF